MAQAEKPGPSAALRGVAEFTDLVAVLPKHDHGVWDAELTADGRFLVSCGGYDNSMIVWTRCDADNDTAKGAAQALEQLHRVQQTRDHAQHQYESQAPARMAEMERQAAAAASAPPAPNDDSEADGNDKVVVAPEVFPAIPLAEAEALLCSDRDAHWHVHEVVTVSCGTNEIAFHPHRNVFFVGRDDCKIHVFELSEEGMPLAIGVWEGHRGYVRTVQVSRDGRMVVSGSGDNTLRLWSTKPLDGPAGLPGVCLAVVEGHTGSVWTVRFSPLSNFVSSSSVDGTTCVWRVPSRESVDNEDKQACQQEMMRVHGFRKSSEQSLVGAFSPDERYFVYSCDSVVLVEMESGAILARFPLGGATVRQLLYSSSGTYVVVGMNIAPHIIVLEATHLVPVARCVPVHSDAVRMIKFSADEQLLITACDDKLIRIFKTPPVLKSTESMFALLCALRDKGSPVGEHLAGDTLFDRNVMFVISNFLTGKGYD